MAMVGDKQEILNEIRRSTQENGGLPLGRERFAQETGNKISRLDWKNLGEMGRCGSRSRIRT
jgi:hypothetical protein